LASVDEITLVRDPKWVGFEVLVINPDQSDKVEVMYDFKVDGVEVLLYSYYHSNQAGLKAWVDNPKNLANIHSVLLVPAPTSSDVDRINPSGGVPPAKTQSVLPGSVDLEGIPATGDASSGSMLGGKSANGLSLTDYSDDVQTTISKKTV